MLAIYHNDRIEDLAESLRARLVRVRRGMDAFTKIKVVVPNANLAKWLRLRVFAKEPSLAFGVEFPFVEGRFHELLAGCLAGSKAVQLLPNHAYANAIASILVTCHDDSALAPFVRYIMRGKIEGLRLDSREQQRMLWQLSVKLADLMDSYENRRRALVAKWLKQDLGTIANPIERAEAAIAKKLFGENGIYPPSGSRLSLRQLYERAAACSPNPNVAQKEKVFVFALSSFTELQAAIIHYLGKAHDVEVYCNNMCREYWGDMDDTQEGSGDSTLLRRWGVAGRETLRLLVELEESGAVSASSPLEFWQRAALEAENKAKERKPSTMLELVQESIRARNDACASVLSRQDASIQVVGAPGIRREVEMVYNAIIGAVWKAEGAAERPWPQCSFSDIAVLVTDMPKYKSAIESVFGARGEVPYSIADTAANGESEYLAAFMALMTLAREGMTRETVFAVLENRCVHKALGFRAGEVRDWRDLADKYCAYDGYSLEGDFADMTWSAALARAAADSPSQGASPAVARLAEIVAGLDADVVKLAALRLTPAEWHDRLRKLADDYIAIAHGDELEEGMRREIFSILRSLCATQVPMPIDFPVVAVEEFATGLKSRKGGYLACGVTIAGLKPMRPVPFRQIFVIGMNEGVFPGRDSDSTLDMRGAIRERGDATQTEVNRYLFLETLMSARDRLVISYQCQDTVKDAELFASGMVKELESFIERHILLPGGEFKETRIPLLERGEADDPRRAECVGPVVWTSEWDTGLLATYSRAARRLAMEESKSCEKDNAASSSSEATQQIVATPEALADFIDAPLDAVLRHRFAVPKDSVIDARLEAQAPLEMPAKGPVRWEFEQAILSSPGESVNVEAVFAEAASRGIVPRTSTELGKLCSRGVLEAFSKGDLASLKAAYRLCKTSQEPGIARRIAFGKINPKAKYPPRRILRPLFDELWQLAAKSGDEETEIRITMFDLPHFAVETWSWRNLTPDSAREYLDKVSKAYSEFPASPSPEGRYRVIRYEEVVDGKKVQQRSSREFGLVIARIAEDMVDEILDEDAAKAAASPIYSLILSGSRSEEL